MGNPCGKYITDIKFLKHMIPHHQVAVDMSKEVLKYSSDPNIIYLARNIIYKQSDEILYMENILLSSIPNLSTKDTFKFIEIPNQFTVWYPCSSRAKKYTCGVHHFDPSKLHNRHGILTDTAYLKHMIPHHDVAVKMSNRVVKYSRNSALVSFAYEIIKNQRYEIWLMKQYLKYSQKQFSPIFYDRFSYKTITY